MICEYCLNPIKKRMAVYHTNTGQKTKKRHFCSKRCKEAWQEQVTHENRSIKVWRLARVGSKLLFIETELSSEEFPIAVATKLGYSHFSMTLEVMTNDELLEHVIQKAATVT